MCREVLAKFQPKWSSGDHVQARFYVFWAIKIQKQKKTVGWPAEAGRPAEADPGPAGSGGPWALGPWGPWSPGPCTLRALWGSLGPYASLLGPSGLPGRFGRNVAA